MKKFSLFFAMLMMVISGAWADKDIKLSFSDRTANCAATAVTVSTDMDGVTAALTNFTQNGTEANLSDKLSPATGTTSTADRLDIGQTNGKGECKLTFKVNGLNGRTVKAIKLDYFYSNGACTPQARGGSSGNDASTFSFSCTKAGSAFGTPITNETGVQTVINSAPDINTHEFTASEATAETADEMTFTLSVTNTGTIGTYFTITNVYVVLDEAVDPSVTLSASSTAVTTGTKITLTAEAKDFTETPTIAYAVAIDGAEATDLESNEYTPATAGTYVFTATATAGAQSATSNEVTVTVTEPEPLGKYLTASQIRDNASTIRIAILNVTTTGGKYINGEAASACVSSDGTLAGVSAPTDADIIVMESAGTNTWYLKRESDNKYLNCAAGGNFTLSETASTAWSVYGKDDSGYGSVTGWDDLFSDIDKSLNENMIRFVANSQYMNGQAYTAAGGLRGGTGAWSFNYVRNADYVDPTVTANMNIQATLGCATFCAPFDVTLPEDAPEIKVYTAEMSEDNEWVKLNEVDAIKAGKCYVLYCKDGYEHNFKAEPTTTDTKVTTGCLIGNLGTGVTLVAPNNHYYVLQCNNDETGWYYVKSGTTINCGVNRCYMDGPTPTDAARAFYPMSTGETTAINSIAATAAKMSDGKYLVNGRIVAVKAGKAYNMNGTLVK